MQVDLKNLPDDLRAASVDVAQRVRAAGGRALMVGGSVRDLLCGRHVKDVDIEVFGLAPDVLKRILGEAYELDLVGLSFGVLKIKHLDIDVSPTQVFYDFMKERLGKAGGASKFPRVLKGDRYEAWKEFLNSH